LSDTRGLPPLISLGELCIEGSCSFIWKSGFQPYLVHPAGHVVDLPVRASNPIYNSRRYEFRPEVPHASLHVPDCHSQRANVTISGSRTALVNEAIGEVVILGGDNKYWII
jgi:hypothetical protein